MNEPEIIVKYGRLYMCRCTTKMNKCIYIYTYTHIFIHVYIYIHVCIYTVYGIYLYNSNNKNHSNNINNMQCPVNFYGILLDKIISIPISVTMCR